MSFEVVVLGAGMVGVSSALALRQRGHRVTLIDRKAPGQETSYGNAGIIQREAVLPYAFPRDWRKVLAVALARGNDVRYHANAMAALAPRLYRYWANSAPGRYERFAHSYASLIAHCLSEHANWIEQAQAEHLIRKGGWMRGFRTPALFDAAALEAQDSASRYGLNCEFLDSAQLAQRVPVLQQPLAGAIHYRDPWTAIDPGDLVAHYAQLFVRMGGRLLRGDASSLQARGAGWAVDTDEGPVTAAHAVLALGPWADQALRRLGYVLPLFVKRGYHRHYVGGATLDMPFLDVEQGVMLAPMRSGLRLTTGAEFARIDAPRTPVQLDAGERSTRALIDLGQGVEAQPWLGARPCTADMNPVIGAAPRHPGLWFNFGHGHQGFTLGPASGRLLAELMDGEQPFVDAAPFAPQRF